MIFRKNSNRSESQSESVSVPLFENKKPISDCDSDADTDPETEIDLPEELPVPVYMLIESRVIDAEKYRQYIAQVPPIIAQHGGRFLVRGGKITPLSDAWNPERIILVEFPSEAHINEWLSSPEYKTIAPLREAGAETRAIILEGYSPTGS